MTVVHSSIGAGFGCAPSAVLANVISPVRYLVQRGGCWLVKDLQQIIPHCIYSRLKVVNYVGQERQALGIFSTSQYCIYL